VKKKGYSTDNINIEIEIDDEIKTLKSIEIKEIDVDVFKPLAIRDKMKMSWFVDALARKIMAVLSDPLFQEGQKKEGR